MPLDGDGDAPVHGGFERVINQVAYYLFHLALVRLDGVLMRFVDFLFESQATQLRVRNVAVRNRRSGCGEVERSAVVRYLPELHLGLAQKLGDEIQHVVPPDENLLRDRFYLGRSMVDSAVDDKRCIPAHGGNRIADFMRRKRHKFRFFLTQPLNFLPITAMRGYASLI